MPQETEAPMEMMLVDTKTTLAMDATLRAVRATAPFSIQQR